MLAESRLKTSGDGSNEKTLPLDPTILEASRLNQPIFAPISQNVSPALKLHFIARVIYGSYRVAARLQPGQTIGSRASPMEFLKQFIRLALPEKIKTRIRHARNSDDPLRDYERDDRRELMRKAFCALAFNKISGDYLEFGSWRGLTFALAYKESRRANFPCKLWSFDSFRGLPPPAGPEDEHPVW